MQISTKGVGHSFWAQVAPDLLLVHRPLPQFAEAAASSADAKRMAGCTTAALKQPLKVPPPSIPYHGLVVGVEILNHCIQPPKT